MRSGRPNTRVTNRHFDHSNARRGGGASSVFGIVLQDRCVVLAAVENANDGYLLGVHVEGDHGAILLEGDA